MNIENINNNQSIDDFSLAKLNYSKAKIGYIEKNNDDEHDLSKTIDLGNRFSLYKTTILNFFKSNFNNPNIYNIINRYLDIIENNKSNIELLKTENVDIDLSNLLNALKQELILSFNTLDYKYDDRLIKQRVDSIGKKYVEISSILPIFEPCNERRNIIIKMLDNLTSVVEGIHGFVYTQVGLNNDMFNPYSYHQFSPQQFNNNPFNNNYYPQQYSSNVNSSDSVKDILNAFIQSSNKLIDSIRSDNKELAIHTIEVLRELIKKINMSAV